jgi:hypothetical protein
MDPGRTATRRLSFTTSADKIPRIDLIANPERLRQLDLVIREDQ